LIFTQPAIIIKKGAFVKIVRQCIKNDLPETLSGNIFVSRNNRWAIGIKFDEE
jgi:hypothetical protein